MRTRVPVDPTPLRHPLRDGQIDLLICVALVLAVFAVYARVVHFEFINFDDPYYITENPHLRNGLTADSVRWALTSRELGFWFPITQLSELLDVQLFGMRSGMHHLTSVIWHALASLCLFGFLRRATGERWRSAFVAFVFALHPLHVESAAWVAERKDVLSGFFWFLTLWLYVRYTERPSAWRYVATLLCFFFGLTSKPMVVTLPLVLVLVDIWPLKRCSIRAPRLKEKIPFLLLSIAAGISVFFAQRSVGAVVTMDLAPLSLRVGNALVSYAVYVWMMFWPAGLAIFYPYVHHLPAWQPLLAGLALAGFSAFVLRLSRRRPYLMVGWLWYLLTLLPVVGIVQIGQQAHADRYMYLPMVGLLIMLAWTVRDKPAARAAGAILCMAAGIAGWVQVGYWKNSETLFRHAEEVTEDNYLAHYSLGVVYAASPNRSPEAIAEYESALRIRPYYVDAMVNLGAEYAKIPGRLPDAIAQYEAALRIQPDHLMAHNNLGAALSKIPGRLPEALAQYDAALRLRPGDPAVLTNRGQALAASGRWGEAIAEYQKVLEADPANAEAHNELGTALANVPGRLPDALAQYREAVRLKPTYAAARSNLAGLLASSDHLPEAIGEYQAALQLAPGDAGIHKSLGDALARSARWADAIAEYEAAIRLRPDFAEAHNNLGFALVNVEGRLPQAIAQFESAIQIQPSYADAENNLGLALLKLPGRRNDAVTHLSAALRLKPNAELQHMIERLKAGKE